MAWLSANKGACTKVVESAPNTGFIQSFETTSDLLRFARDSGYQLLSSQEVRPDAETLAKIDPQLDANTHEKWLLQRGLRLKGQRGDPLGIDRNLCVAVVSSLLAGSV